VRGTFPRGVSTAALRLAPHLTYDQKDTLQAQMIHHLTGEVFAPPTHWIPSARGFVEAAARGIGWGVVPEVMAAPEIASGRLRRLRRDATLEVPLYWQRWRLDTDLMRRLTAAVLAAAATMNG
jgi:LysR family transcriptional regulator, chromosome initiation inhibitor